MRDAKAIPPRLSISVALATYNGAAFLPAQLNSIVGQSEPPDEIVITDDQSTDATPGLLADYAARSPIPIYVHSNPERLGFVRNFARAIRLCRSELIFTSDQDDVWAHEKIAVMRPMFMDPDVLLAYHNAQVVTADDRPLFHLFDAQEAKLNAVWPLHPWHASAGMTQAFRASLRVYDDLWPPSLNHIWMEKERLNHDQWYFFLAQVLGRVAYVDKLLIRYRQHGNNTIGGSPRRPHNLWRRFLQNIDYDPRIDRLRAHAAERRADILHELAARLDGLKKAHAESLMIKYLRLSDRLRRRRLVYTEQGFLRRLVALIRLVGHGDYSDYPWGFRPSSIVREIISGVPGRHAQARDQAPSGRLSAPSEEKPSTWRGTSA
ncbi:glycosyltransferase [uncultured Sphingomonas sp.]|uniref:glycosyltransferase n=1 Tax=uncultured Sphingomonas sp. TaxID=158754 RepID=UPI0035CB1BF3